MALFAVFVFLALPALAMASTARQVDMYRLQADVNPVTAQYIDRCVGAARAPA